MRKLSRLFIVFLGLLAIPLVAQAKVRISVDLSSQRMSVNADSGASYSWPISSARAGYVTPRGIYSAISLQTMHHSKKYHNSPMPHSIFFHGGYAIHGTYAIGALGRPASHGCVRISPANAATLFSLVRAEGATIQIVGTPPVSRPFAGEHHHHRHTHYAAAHHHGHAPTALSYAPQTHNESVNTIFRSILLR
jgi:ABC-type nickel/cobalt efflux system permease component RcnA